jgi:ABC-2 type transport system ATP-binding protein
MREQEVAPPGIVVRGVQKRFGTVTALQGVDLVVNPGEIVALLGPNGAGKSTLLRILSTIILPDQGQAFIGGVDVTRNRQAAQRKFGLSLGEERAWYWRLTGRQNLEFFATLYGLDRQRAKGRINTLLEEFSLAHVADRRFNTYSSGMKARFSLMRALLPTPEVVLLDEPTRSLDPMAALEFRANVANQRDIAGTALLLTTHDMHEAAVLADRIAVLVKGRIAAQVNHGPTAEQLQEFLVSTVHEWA